MLTGHIAHKVSLTFMDHPHTKCCPQYDIQQEKSTVLFYSIVCTVFTYQASSLFKLYFNAVIVLIMYFIMYFDFPRKKEKKRKKLLILKKVNPHIAYMKLIQALILDYCVYNEFQTYSLLTSIDLWPPTEMTRFLYSIRWSHTLRMKFIEAFLFEYLFRRFSGLIFGFHNLN